VIKPSILIVERGVDERELYGEYFAWAGFRVALATSGVEGFQKAVRLRPDVITAGFDPLDVNAIGLCTRLKGDVRTCDIPVVIVTARAYRDDCDRARAAGADAVLPKPCLPKVLLTRTRQLMRRASQVKSPRV